MSALVLVILGVVWLSHRAGPSAVLSSDETERVVYRVTHVQQSVLDAVGAGTGPNQVRRVESGPLLLGGTGKPQVLYIGAEFCPYCASERWPLIVALSQFGDFAQLKLIRSASADAYPNTATLSFEGSRYESPYLDFVPVETETRDHVPLRAPSLAQQALFARYDEEDVIPFVDLGNRSAVVGSGFLPTVLRGKSWQEIARALDDPTDPATVAIVGHANHLTAAICGLTDGQPVTVCASRAVSLAGSN